MVMHTPAEWREMLLQYRLHELDEVRREQIDALLIGDADFSAAMQEAEYDLLDAYAAHELNETDRLRVERALLPCGRFSPEAPGRVIGRGKTAGDASAGSFSPVRELPAPSSARPHWTPLWTLAAVLVLGSFVAVSLWRSHPSGLPSGQPDAQQQAAVHPAPAPAGTPAAPSGPVQAPATAAPAPARPESAVAEVILPGALRSQAVLQVKLAPGVRTVRFLWPNVSPGTASAVAYELQLVGDNGARRCHSRGVAAGRNRGVEFSCAAAQVPAGTSFLRVVTATAAPDDPPQFEITVEVQKLR